MQLRNIRICVGRKLIGEFKKEAKAVFPRETFAYLLGRDAGTVVEIEELFFPPDVNDYCSENSVTIGEDWLYSAKEHAKESSLSVVGDIHSHPYRHRDIGRLKPDCAPSAQDMDCGIPHISAICQVRERRDGSLISSVRFWGPMFPVSEEIS